MTAVFALSLLSCGREVTGPGNGLNYGRARTASLALDPHMPSLVSQLVGASDVVPFERVRIVLVRDDFTVALDTIVTFPSDADSLALTLTLPLPLNTPDDGLPLALSMAYINAQGDTVFRAGPSNILALPVGSTGSAQPITLPVRYDGVGAGAASVVIAPDSLVVVAGTASVFTAEARDGQGTAIANTPLLFFTLDSTRALVADPGVGAVTWLPVRGTARIVAALPDGARADTAFVTVELPASQLVLGSGNAQAGPIGAALLQPLVARVLAADGVPVAGVEVVFAATMGGGSLSVLTDTSDANGEVETTWTLGVAIGAQTVTATAAGLTGSPLTFTATAAPSDPAQLVIVGQPNAGTAGAALAPALVVAVQDIEGNTVPNYTGAVSVAFAEPQDAVLGGTTTVNAVAGLATFANLTINLTGTYTLVASSDTLPVVVTAPIAIASAEAILPDMLVQPGGGVAGVVLPAFSAVALDQFGNTATGFIGVATLTAERSGSPANVIVAGGEATVIDGVATFDAVQIDTAGTYWLVIDFGAIGTIVTSEFTVVPAPASTIALLDGNAQSGVVATTLPAPLRVRVTDDFGNGVSGVDVTWSVTTGLAQFTDTVVATDANGVAATSVLLGVVPSSLQFAASAAGLAGAPVNFTATTTAGAATQLTVQTEPAATTVAGETLAPIVVVARDALGNIATGFVGTVEATIATGVGGVPLGGATTTNAVAGIATFDQLVIDTRGAYTLRFTSAGLTDTVSAAFDITPAAAAAMQVQDGNAQADTVGATLADPLRVVVLDAFGNGVPNQAVAWAITSGGGALAADTVITDVDGFAGVVLTLPTTTGVTTVEASIAGLTGSPVAFTATTNAGAPVVLALTSAPDTVVAGSVAEPIVLTVRDANGNAVEAYTDSVTILASDAPGDFASGTTTVAAVAGVATFNDLVFNEPGGWFLDVNSGVLNEGVSLTVVVGAPSTFAIVSGGAQAGFATLPLPAPLVVSVTDAVGNPVVGGLVEFVVTAGGGTLTGGVVRDSVLTDANGVAQTTWTLGADTQVTHEVEAFFAGLPTLVFTATAEVAVANRTWTGAFDAAWTNTANWAEGVVPVATDSVRIPAGAPFMPALSAPATVSRLTVEDGATLQIFDFAFTVNGSVRVPEVPAILGDSGVVVANAPTTGTISGSFLFLSVIGGDYLVTGPLAVAHDLVIANAAQLDVATFPVTVGLDLFTTGSGVLEMNAGADVSVTRDASFNGGSTAGFLTGGTLRVRGNFSAGGVNAAAFSAAAAHVTVLDGAGIQTVAFSNPDVATAPTCVASCFGTLSSPKVTGGLTFTSSAKALGGMTVTGESLSAVGQTLISAGTPVLTSTTVTAGRVGWQTGLSRSANFAVDTLVAWGAGSELIGFENIPTIVVGAHRITTNFNADLIVEGELDVDGAGIVISDSLITRGSGRLRMTDASDSLIVNRNVRFGGETEPGLMTNGVLQIGGSLFQSAAVGVSSIAADNGQPRIRMTGFSATISIGDPANNPMGTLIIASGADADFGDGAARFLGPIILESGSGGTYGFAAEVSTVGGLVDSSSFGWGVQTTRFEGVDPLLPPYIDGDVIFANAATLSDSLSVGGSLRVTTAQGFLALNGQRVRAGTFATDDGGRLSMGTAADSLVVTGNVAFEGATSVLNAGYLGVGTGLYQSVTPDAIRAGPAHETRLTGLTAAVLSFANPGFEAGQSHLGRLVVAKSNVQASIALNTNVFVNGVLEVLPTQFYSLTSTNNRLVSRGASVSDITFLNTQWELLDGSAVAPIANVTFDQMALNATSLRIARSGGTVQLQQPSFLSGVEGGYYLEADDTAAADGDNLTVAVTTPTPEFAGFGIRALNGAVITGWTSNPVLNWGGYNIGGDWNDPGNWQESIVPGAADSVVIGSADYAPVISTPVTVRSLVSAIGNPVTVNSSLTVTDWLTIITAQGFAPIACGGGGEIVLAAVDSVVVNGTTTCAVRATSGRTALAGPFDVGSIAIENSAQVDIDTWTLTSAGALATRDAGTLRMDNLNSTVSVGGEARFEGGSTNGLLTQGSLNLSGDFVQGVNPQAFQAGTGHRTRFQGNVDQAVTFANPDTTTAGSFFGILAVGQNSEGSSVGLFSNVFAIGPLETGDGFQRVFRSPLTEAPQLFSRGANGINLTFGNVRWYIGDGGALATGISDVRFETMNIVGTNPAQLRIARSTGAVTLTNFEFDTLSTGDYLWVDDPDQGASGLFSVTMASTIPSFHSGRILTDGFASISGWSEVPLYTWTGNVSNVWGDAGNWQSGLVPDSASAVVIPGGIDFAPAIVADSILVGSVTMAAGSSLSLTGTSFGVSGSFLADPTATIIADPDSPIFLFGEGSVRGNFPSIFFTGDFVVAGTFSVDSTLGITAGNLDLAGNSVTVGGTLATSGDGTLTMNNAETVTVGDLAFFGGGSTTGRLTSGRLILQGDFVQSGDVASFDATGTHVTEFAPALAASPVVTFFNPTTSGFGNLEIANGRIELGTATAVRGNLSFAETTELAGPGTISVTGDITSADATAEIFVPRVAFGGAFNFLGFYGADTTEFIGTAQPIPARPNAPFGTWQHLIVSGTTTFTDTASLAIAGTGSLTLATGGELTVLQAGSIDLFTTPITSALGSTLRVANGGVFRSRAHSELAGALVIDSGAVTFFNSGGLDGQHIFPAGSSVSGAGTFDVNGANLVQVAGAFNVGTLQLLNATLAFNGADTAFVGGGAYAGGGFLNGTGVLAIRGAFSSTFGNPNGTGTIAVLPGGTFTLASPLRGWNLDVAGTLVWGDNNLGLELFGGQNPQVLIRTGGLLDIQHGATAWSWFGSAANTLTNNGTIRKSSGTATATIVPVVSNPGVIETLAGTLAFPLGCTNVGAGTGCP